MITKKMLFDEHLKRHGKNAVSESAFRKRLTSGRSGKEAIDTPSYKTSYYDPFFKCNSREKAEKIEKIGVDPAKDGGDSTAIVIHFHHLEEIQEEIERIGKYIRMTGILGSILFCMCLLYWVVRLFTYLFYGL